MDLRVNMDKGERREEKKRKEKKRKDEELQRLGCSPENPSLLPWDLASLSSSGSCLDGLFLTYLFIV